MDSPFDIDIIGTGSSGNAVLIDNTILIDIGLPWRDVGNAAMSASRIFVTHRHADHLGMSAVRGLLKHRPAMVKHGLYVNRESFDHIAKRAPGVASMIPESHIIRDNTVVEHSWRGSRYRIEAYSLVHNVENHGFVITNLDTGKRLIHATDTMSMHSAPPGIYDVLLIEGNYDEDVIDDTIDLGTDAEAWRAMQNFRHFSVQEMERYVRLHSHPESIVVQLHESSDFGSKSVMGVDFTIEDLKRNIGGGM